jgi:hypothetical protein
MGESTRNGVAAIDDFTIVLDEPWHMESCGIELFEGLGQLWKLVQRYGMKTPLMINVVDSQSICVRTLSAVRDETGRWQLTDQTPPTNTTQEGKSIAFPLIIDSTDSSGNVLKVRVQLARSTPLSNREQLIDAV